MRIPSRSRSCLFVCLVSTPLAIGPHARANATLPAPGWDDARCGHLAVTGAGGNHAITDFAARLADPGKPDLIAGRLHASAVRVQGPDQLDGLPGLFAGGMLVGLLSSRPHDCDLTHAFRNAAITLSSLPKGADADQRWTAIRATDGENDFSIGTLRLHMENDRAGDVTRVIEEATGLSGAGNDMTATPIEHLSGKFSAPRPRLAAIAAGGDLLPSDTVTIEKLSIRSGDAVVEATGQVHPATRTGKLEVRAKDMEAIKDALPTSERDRAGAAFLVMRLAANRDPDGSLRWEVVWEDGLVTINGVPVPMRF